jgi:hypothetical protein
MTKKPCKGSHFLAESESELSRLVGLSSIVPLVPPHPKPCTPGPQSTRSADFSPQQADPTQPRSFPPAPSSRRRRLDRHGARTSVRSRPTPPSRVHSLQRLQAEDVGSTDTERGLQSAAGRPHPAPVPSPSAPSSRRRWLDRHGAPVSTRMKRSRCCGINSALHQSLAAAGRVKLMFTEAVGS